MKRVGWITDPHFNFVQPAKVHAFCKSIADAAPDALLVGGDIAEAHSFENFLRVLEQFLQRPIYFVLGNHDFYRGSIGVVRMRARLLAERSRWLHWLTASGPIALTETTGLIGHGSWADGRLGKSHRSKLMLNDYVLIEDFVSLKRKERFQKLEALGDEAAAAINAALSLALARFRRVFLLTHVPPFGEACWHDGKISDAEWLPHFACRAVGEMLRRTMEAHSDRHLTVLCGHTHGSGEVTVAPNLLVRTGGAEYGEPQLQEMLEVA